LTFRRFSTCEDIKLLFIVPALSDVSNGLSITHNFMSAKATNAFKSPLLTSDKAGLMTNNFMSSNNNFMSSKVENLLKVNNDPLNKTHTSLRKSFNCDEYLSSLRMKLGNNTHTVTKPNNHFTDYIFQEKEYLKKSIADQNAPEKDFEFEIRKELDKINQKNTSILHNDGFQSNFEHQNKFGLHSYSNNFNKPSPYEEKTNFDITDGKQFFSPQEIGKSPVTIEKKVNLNNNYIPNNTSSNHSNNSQQDLKKNEKVDKPPSMVQNLHYNNVKIDKISETNKSKNEEEHHKKLVIDDDEFEI